MEVSQTDKDYYLALRESVEDFILKASIRDTPGLEVLDIAPEIHDGAKKFFTMSNLKTLDIDPKSDADYIADICENNSNMIPDGTFDIIICTEVLEHTHNPFEAAQELNRMLKPSGVLFVTTPFNFRIHNPLPDYWRFTIHGLRLLFNHMDIFEIEELESERFLMPIQYRLIAGKKI